MSYQNGPRIVTNGLVLCLDAGNSKSYPGSGTAWNDLSGNGNNGTLTNGPTFSSSNRGGIVFDGTNDYTFLGLISSLQFERTDPFSCTCIAKNNNTAAVALSIIGNSQTGPAYKGWTFNFYNRLVNKASSICLALYSNDSISNTLEVYTIANSISQNTIYSIACTYDGSSTASGIKLYINGVSQTTYTTYNSLTSSIKNTTENLYIGSRGAVGQYMNGSIYSLQMYNRTLSSNEILQNYNATKGRFGL